MLISLSSAHESFNGIIKSLRQQAGFSVSKMSRLTGVHRNTQINYELNREPDIDYLVRFSDATSYPFLHLLAQRVRFGGYDKALSDRVMTEMVAATAKPSSEHQVQGASAVFEWLFNLCRPSIAIYEQSGEAMRPTIADGDCLFVDTDHKKINDGEIFVVNIGDEYTARRLQSYPGGGIMISADNGKIKPIKIEREHVAAFEIVGKLIVSINTY